MANLFTVEVTYKYTASKTYKTIPYRFASQQEYDDWFNKEIRNESIRKIIKLNEKIESNGEV